MVEHYHFAHHGIAHQRCHVSLAPFPDADLADLARCFDPNPFSLEN